VIRGNLLATLLLFGCRSFHWWTTVVVLPERRLLCHRGVCAAVLSRGRPPGPDGNNAFLLR